MYCRPISAVADFECTSREKNRSSRFRPLQLRFWTPYYCSVNSAVLNSNCVHCARSRCWSNLYFATQQYQSKSYFCLPSCEPTVLINSLPFGVLSEMVGDLAVQCVHEISAAPLDTRIVYCMAVGLLHCFIRRSQSWMLASFRHHCRRVIVLSTTAATKRQLPHYAGAAATEQFCCLAHGYNNNVTR